MNDIQSIQTVCTDSLVLIKVLTLLSSSSLSPFPVTSVSVTLYILFMRHGIQIFLVSPKQKMRENCHFGEESQENVASLLLLFLLVFVEYFLCVFFFFRFRLTNCSASLFFVYISFVVSAHQRDSQEDLVFTVDSNANLIVIPKSFASHSMMSCSQSCDVQRVWHDREVSSLDCPT